MNNTPPMMKPKRQNSNENRSLNQVWKRVRGEGVAIAHETVNLPPFTQEGHRGEPKHPNLLPAATSPTPQVWLERLEDLVMRDGWPVPLTRLYLIHHDRLLFLLDGLRDSLKGGVGAGLYESIHGLPHPLYLSASLSNTFHRAGHRH